MQWWEKEESFLRQELTKEQKGHCNTEKIFFATGEDFDHASNGYIALYYYRGCYSGRYRNDVKPREFDKSVDYEPGWSLRHLGKGVCTLDLN